MTAGELNEAANLRWVLITFTKIQFFGFLAFYAVGCTCQIRYIGTPQTLHNEDMHTVLKIT